MSHTTLPEEFWREVEPLLPADRAAGRQGGRRRVLNHVAMRGIFFVLCTGIRWEDLPREFGCCSMTCWRRLRDWQSLDVWNQRHQMLVAALRKVGILDLSLAIVDSSTTRAVGGGEATGPNPTDRRKPGTKQHLIVGRNGVPLVIRITGANRSDVQEIVPLIVHLPPIAGRPGHPITKPAAVQADRAYHDQSVDALLSWLGIRPLIAKRNTPHGSGLGRTRWVVQRNFAWRRGFRRLRIRFDRREFIYHAWNSLAAAVICWRILTEASSV